MHRVDVYVCSPFLYMYLFMKEEAREGKEG
jgi:hypothetical protein